MGHLLHVSKLKAVVKLYPVLCAPSAEVTRSRRNIVACPVRFNFFRSPKLRPSLGSNLIISATFRPAAYSEQVYQVLAAMKCDFPVSVICLFCLSSYSSGVPSSRRRAHDQSCYLLSLPYYKPLRSQHLVYSLFSQIHSQRSIRMRTLLYQIGFKGRSTHLFCPTCQVLYPNSGTA